MRKFLVTILLCLIGHISYAQRGKVYASITSRDRVKIENEIVNKFTLQYKEIIKIITSSDQSVTDKTDAIANSLTDIFQSKESRIENDLGSEKVSSSGELLTADVYLDKMKDEIKAEDEESIDFNFKNDDYKYFTNIDGVLYSVVGFSQKWKATDTKGKKLKSCNRKAILKLEKNGPEWTVHIELILFENSDDKMSEENGWQRVIIKETNENDEAITSYDKEYYYSRFKQGVEYVKTKEFAKAYYCLTQANQFKNDKDLTAKIQDKQSELKKSVSSLSENEESWYILIAQRLQKEAKQLESNYNYIEAFNYISLAKSTNRDDESIAFLSAYNNIKQKADELKVLNGYYSSGKYEEGILAFRNAIKLEPQNSYLYLGLAQCLSRNNKKGAADTIFLEAINLAPDNLDIYLAQAEHLRKYKKNAEAEKVYITYLGKASVLNPNYIKAQAYKAYCKALDVFSKNPAECKDTCLQILRHYKPIPEVYILLSKLALERKANNLFPEYGEKMNYINLANSFADSAITMGMKSEGYFQKAKILIDKHRDLDMGSKEERNCLQEIILNFSKSIESDKRNYNAYKELGNIYLEMGIQSLSNDIPAFKEQLENAIKAYAVPIGESGFDGISTVKWKMAKCKYLMGFYQEANELIQSTKSEMENLRNDQFNSDFALIKLKNNEVSVAKQFADKSSSSLGKYVQLLCRIKITPGYLGSVQDKELKEIFDGIENIYSSSMIENDFMQLGQDVNGKVKKALSIRKKNK